MGARPLVLLHGLTGSPASWDAVSEALGSRQPIVSPVLLGHGGEPAETTSLDFEGEVDRLAALILTRTDAPVHVCGYSLGGRLALGLAIRHPALVAHTTLIGTHPGLVDATARRERAAWESGWIRLLEQRGLVPFVDAWEKLPLFASQTRLPEETRQRQRAERLSHRPEGIALAIRALGLSQMPAYVTALPELRSPVTLMFGELDRKFAELARMMSRTLPSARVVSVADAGHNVVLERPECVVAELYRDSRNADREEIER